MRLLVSLVLAPTVFAATLTYQVAGNAAASWPAILSSIGFVPSSGTETAEVMVAPDTADLAARVQQGAIAIVEGDSSAARAFGFHPTAQRVTVRSIEDLRAPKLETIWEQAADLPVFELPADARVFARERHQGAPLLAGVRRGQGAVLWLATPPGERGYERFPYLPQALADLGLAAPFRSQNLWAFFDSSYRLHVDVDYFAPKWRAAGIAALHVAAWHYWERDPQGDEYLRHLIEACHRNGILVYAWLELPHVSDKFWDQHPQWREKTALLQDAQLDWRKLMNLENPDASKAVAQGLSDLISRFDWDGVNLAELYFESLEGYDNPARFTPMNDNVRAEFKAEAGFDPHELFDASSPRRAAANASGLTRFLDFRSGLAARLQSEWLQRVEAARAAKPNLDVVLTHVDDRFDTSIREKTGADASRVLPLLSSHDFTFLIEDPATIWNLGPQRYAQIAARYRPLLPREAKTAESRLGIDINVVERYQDVYPTKQQTGVELFELVHQAALNFPRVALYFESSILKPDLPLLAAAASAVTRAEQHGSRLTLDSPRGTGVAWPGPALVDGKLWPVSDGITVWLPKGAHTVEPSPDLPPRRITAFNGEIESAALTSSGLEFSYRSDARALATLDVTPTQVLIDGAAIHPDLAGDVLLLPRGQHLVTIEASPASVAKSSPNK